MDGFKGRHAPPPSLLPPAPRSDISLPRPRAAPRCAVGGYAELEELVGDLSTECHAAAEAYLTLHPDMRRGKVLASAEAFVGLVAASAEALLAEARLAIKAVLKRAERRSAARGGGGGGGGGGGRGGGGGGGGGGDPDLPYGASSPDAPPVVLPPCIYANREPFRHGEWRKTAFAAR